MTSNRNFFTYLCYILFIICTLLLLGRCFGIPEPSDYIKIASGAGVVIVTAVICILLCLLCAVLIHKMRKGRFVAEVIITILIFAAVAAIKIYTYTELTAFIFLAGLVLFYFSVRVACGGIAAVVSLVACSFLPVEDVAACSLNEILFLNAVIWALFLWFAIFWKVYQKKCYNMKAGYITIALLGIASNSLYFINQTALLFIIITIMFMLFRHWKPAFLYMFCAFPALFFKGFEIITAFDRNMVVSILKLRFAYDYVPYTDIYDVSRYFYSVDRLFYIVIYAFAAAAVIMMFAQKRKSIQILMCYVSVVVIGLMFQVNMGAESFILITYVYILMASYFLQSVYSHMAEKKYKEIEKDVLYGCKTQEKINNENIISKDSSSDMLPVPIYAYGYDSDKAKCVIKNADEYKKNIDENLIAALAKKKEKARNKAAQNNKH
mgnify:FL=1